MATLVVSPSWFFGYDVAFELVFALIALVTSLLARRVYKITEQRSALLLHLSFMLFSLSYFVQSIFNFFIISKLSQDLPKLSIIYSVLVFDVIATYTHIFLMMGGLALLLFMTLKSSSGKTLGVIFIITMLSVILSADKLVAYYVMSSVFLIFISWNYIANYFANKQAKTLLIAFAFILLFFGNFHFLLSVNHSVFYVVAHLLGLAAYLLVLANIYLVLRK